jgi:putative transposase
MKNVSGPQVVTTTEAIESPLPAEIQEALGELVGAARDALLALSVGVGLRVVHELMEAEVTEIVGPKSKHDPDRSATRHGHEDGSMTLGGRRVPVSRPRVRGSSSNSAAKWLTVVMQQRGPGVARRQLAAQAPPRRRLGGPRLGRAGSAAN